MPTALGTQTYDIRLEFSYARGRSSYLESTQPPFRGNRNPSSVYLSTSTYANYIHASSFYDMPSTNNPKTRGRVARVGPTPAIHTVLPSISVESANSFISHIVEQGRYAKRGSEAKRSLLGRVVAAINGPNLLRRDPPAMVRLTRNVVKLANGEYIYDTGATIHLTDNKSELHDYVELPPSQQIKIGGAFGGGGKAIGRGTLIGDFELPDGSISRIEFRDVYYAPTLGHKLLSGFQVSQTGCTALISKDDLRLRSPSGQILAVMPVDQRKGSIVVKASWLSPPNPDSLASSCPAPDALVVADENLWHQRFGHVGCDRIKSMEAGGVVTGLKFGNRLSSSPKCEPCASGKSTILPVPHVAQRRAEKPLERLHSDTWGKAPEKGRRNGEQHIFAVVDDFSRFTWAEGLKTRDLVGPAIVDTITMLDRQARDGNKVKRFRRDGAKEYNSGLVDDFFSAERHRRRGNRSVRPHAEWRRRTVLALRPQYRSGVAHRCWIPSLVLDARGSLGNLRQEPHGYIGEQRKDAVRTLLWPHPRRQSPETVGMCCARAN